MTGTPVLFLISFISALQFSNYSSFTSLVKFIPRCLIVVDVILNRITFLLSLSLFFILFYFIFSFLGPHPWHMEVPRLRVKSELQLPAYPTATATPDPRQTPDLCRRWRQRWILNPLSEARDPTCILMEASQIPFCRAMTGTPTLVQILLFFNFFFKAAPTHMEVSRLGVKSEL